MTLLQILVLALDHKPIGQVGITSRTTDVLSRKPQSILAVANPCQLPNRQQRKQQQSSRTHSPIRLDLGNGKSVVSISSLETMVLEDVFGWGPATVELLDELQLEFLCARR